MDFYIRVFVEVLDDKAGVKDLSMQIGNVYQSTQCPSFYIAPFGQMGGRKGPLHQNGRLTTGVCTETGAPLKVAGPVWLGPMHDQDVLKTALERLQGKGGPSSYPDLKFIATKERLRGLLTSCLDELPDVPLHYKLPELSKCLKIPTPRMVEVKSALVNAGYRVSGFHKEPSAVKTDAPSRIVWDVLRAWAKLNGWDSSKKGEMQEPSVRDKILAVEPSVEINFSPPKQVLLAQADLTKVSRFPVNPEANWGPKQRATGLKRKMEEDPKQGEE
jgi:tRNA (guanine26-N2/guanine27-N2)-dimethyltransferase